MFLLAETKLVYLYAPMEGERERERLHYLSIDGYGSCDGGACEPILNQHLRKALGLKEGQCKLIPHPTLCLCDKILIVTSTARNSSS